MAATGRPVVRIRLTAPSGPVVTVEAGPEHALRQVAACTLDDLGLSPGEPPAPGPELRSAPGLDVPAIARALPGGRFDPVWLDLPHPRGYLHTLPWEGLLLDLGRPIWRGSRTAPLPRLGAPSLTVTVCAGAWPHDRRGMPERPSEAWAVPAQRRADVRVFTTPPDGTSPAFTGPPPVDGGLPAHDGSAADLTDPWLLGVRDALDGRALDVLHVVAPGVFTGGRGAVRAPDGHAVGAAQLSAFLGRTGAWCLMLTGSSATGSMAALRDLADATATARPCVTLTHDADEPYEPPADLIPGRNLGPLFGRAFGTEAAGSAPPASPAVATWVAPSFVDGSALRADPPPVGPRARAALARDHAPGWVAAYLRDLELRDAGQCPDDPAVTTTRAHLTALLEDLVGRYVTAEG